MFFKASVLQMNEAKEENSTWQYITILCILFVIIIMFVKSYDGHFHFTSIEQQGSDKKNTEVHKRSPTTSGTFFFITLAITSIIWAIYLIIQITKTQ